MRSPILLLASLMLVVIRPHVSPAQELLFPRVEGWKLILEESAYNPDNLFDIIDGAADLYLEYEFVDLHIGRYSKDNLEIKAELYRHHSAVDAFGIFSQERFEDYHFIDLGAQGYLEKGALNFLSGLYYVKISTIQEGPGAQDALLVIGKEIERHLQQGRAWPEIFAAFPKKAMKAYSEQYIAKSFLGYAPLNSVFVASYDDGSPFRAFVIKFATPQEARSTLTIFIKALPTNVTQREMGGKQEIQDPNNGLLEVVQEGSFLYGVLSTGAAKRRDNFLTQFGKRLSSIK